MIGSDILWEEDERSCSRCRAACTTDTSSIFDFPKSAPYIHSSNSRPLDARARVY